MNLAVLSSLVPRLFKPSRLICWYDFPGPESSVKLEFFPQKFAFLYKILKILLPWLSELANFALFFFEGGPIFNSDPKIVKIFQKSIVLAQFFQEKTIFTLKNHILQISEKCMLEKPNFWSWKLL